MSSEQNNNNVWYNKFWFTRKLVWTYVALISCYLDIKHFFMFRKEMKDLASDPRSSFSQMGLKVNWLGNIVYTHKILDQDRVLYFNERQKNHYLIDNTRMEHDFLFHDRNWGEYLVTNFVEFSDERDNPSGYYGIEFRFVPISLFNKKIFLWALFYIIVFGLPIWMCRHWIWLGMMSLWNLIKI